MYNLFNIIIMTILRKIDNKGRYYIFKFPISRQLKYNKTYNKVMKIKVKTFRFTTKLFSVVTLFVIQFACPI